MRKVGRPVSRRPSLDEPSLSFEGLRGLRTRSYVRESTARQAGPDHYGPDVQRAGMHAFCERHGLRAPTVEYFDTASGRSIEKRGAFQQALEDADEYDVLLVFHSSRSFRNRHDAAVFKRRFRLAGLAIVFTDQQLISGNPETSLQEGFHELIDEQRSQEQGRFISGGLRQKFERGGVNGKPPLGYRRYHGDPGDPRNGSLVVDAHGKRTVRAIVELYMTGRHSMAELAVILNAQVDEEGEPLHRSRLGQPLTKGAIEEILRNRTYTGVAVWRAGRPEEQIRPGTHEAIISEDEWRQIGALRQSRTTLVGRRPRARAYPLSRLTRCHECGASFAGDTGGRQGSRRLRHSAGIRCSSKRSHPADRIEAQFGEVLSALFRVPGGYRELVLRELRTEEGTSEPAVEPAAERVRATLARLKQLYLWGDIGEVDYRRQRETLRRQLASLEPRRESKGVHDAERAAELLSDMRTLWAHPGVTQEQRQAFVEEAFEEIQVADDGIAAVLPRGPYLLLAALAAGMEMVGETGFEPATS